MSDKDSGEVKANCQKEWKRVRIKIRRVGYFIKYWKEKRKKKEETLKIKDEGRVYKLFP